LSSHTTIKDSEKTLKELISYLSESGKGRVSKVSKQESLTLEL